MDNIIYIRPKMSGQIIQQNIRIGKKEKDLLRKLFRIGITPTEGEVIWKLIYLQARAHNYEPIVFKRLIRLAEKGILVIKNDGPRGGKKIYFTPMGYELAKKINNNFT